MSYSHILISRPEPAIRQLAARLSKLGLDVVSVPSCRFEALVWQGELPRDWAGPAAALMVFTSPRAVEFGLPAFPRGVPDTVTMASLGPATSRKLRAAGFDPIQATGPGFDTEALIDALPETRSPGHALIITAPGGRTLLREALQAAGWAVTVVEVYQRMPLPVEHDADRALAGAKDVISVWTSAEALEQVLGALGSAARERVLAGAMVVPSARLEALARTVGAAHVVRAMAPDNESLGLAVEGLLSPA